MQRLRKPEKSLQPEPEEIREMLGWWQRLLTQWRLEKRVGWLAGKLNWRWPLVQGVSGYGF